jgi:vacuolar-type H+-ATPase subunit H
MAELRVAEHLVRQLKEIAEREHRSVDDVVETMIEQYQPSVGEAKEDTSNEESGLWVLAKTAQELGLSSGQSNISERSREILNTEYPEYLMRRRRGQYDDDATPNAD